MTFVPPNIPAAKKSLGQNFLQDSNIARKIVSALDITPEDHVIEIGPGPGALTGHLLKSEAARLALIEKDSYWARFHAHAAGQEAVSHDSLLSPEHFYGQAQRMAVFEGDALKFPWRLLDRSVKVIGNLPYNVASPLMWDIVSCCSGLTRAVFMIQKEVGLRLVAQPRSSDYGALSVWVQTFCRAKIEFIVPPQVFVPRPKVHSAVVSFIPYEPREHVNTAGLSVLLKTCFQARRKQLGNSLKKIAGAEEALRKSCISPSQRPEELFPADFHRLVSFLFTETC